MTKPCKIRVLYFDGSAAMRQKFLNYFANKELINIVGILDLGIDTAMALESDNCAFLNMLKCDVLVMRKDNLATDFFDHIKKIKKNCTVKIIGLLNSGDIKNDEITKEFDYCVEMPDQKNFLTEEDAYTQLIYKIKTARLSLNMERGELHGKWAILPLPNSTKTRTVSLIAIGASAGGTEAISKVLEELPDDLPPILVVQHIPENFTDFFSNNLAGKISMKVVVTHGGETLNHGTVYIAGNGKHLEVIKSETGDYYTKCSEGEKISGHRPSVDMLFESIARTAGASAVGVILTGMGNDGAQGLLEMREAGAYTIGQDKETSTVYGMPMAAYAMGAVVRQLPLDGIAKEIVKVAYADKKAGEIGE